MGISRNRLVPGLVGLAASAAIVLPLGIGMPVSSATAEENAPVQTLNVDYGTTTGDFYGGSSGMLYGLGDEGSPTDAILDGARVQVTSQKPADGLQHPQQRGIQGSGGEHGGNAVQGHILFLLQQRPF